MCVRITTITYGVEYRIFIYLLSYLLNLLHSVKHKKQQMSLDLNVSCRLHDVNNFLFGKVRFLFLDLSAATALECKPCIQIRDDIFPSSY